MGENMPELPEVEVTRLGFATRIEGARITAVRLGLPLRWPLGCEPKVLCGQTVHGVTRRGKYLLLKLDSGVLLVHLGMSGRLIFDNGLDVPGKHDHFDLLTTKGTLRLHDPRRFGAVVWSASLQNGMALKLLGGLGAEPFDVALDAQGFWLKLRQRRSAIKQVLLAGNPVVGVGNIYASEALFRAGIDPRKTACKISAPKAARLLEAIREVLLEAIAQGGSTLRDFRGAQGEHGLFQLQAKVYGRVGEPCVQCGRPVRRIVQAQRATFFCAHCQK